MIVDFEFLSAKENGVREEKIVDGKARKCRCQ